MLTHLLDTSVYCQRLKPAPLASVERRWRKLGDAPLCISSICEAELRCGLAKRNARHFEGIDGLVVEDWRT